MVAMPLRGESAIRPVRIRFQSDQQPRPSHRSRLRRRRDRGEHLARCLVYVDLNMVRARAVTHPRDWPTSGYHEIQGRRQRYRIVDRQALAEALQIDVAQLAEAHRQWIEETLIRSRLEREPHWSRSIAVGSRAYVDRAAKDLRGRA